MSSYAVERTFNLTPKPGGYCAILLLDVKNAFNSASWEWIYRSLEGRVPGYFLAIVSDYLRDRSVVVDTDEGRVEIGLSAGVAQGSVKGPFNWNVQYDDSLNMELPGNAEFVGFADDVALVVVAQDPIELQDVTNGCLEPGVTWIAGGSLVLAVPKCETVVVTRWRGFRKCKPPVFLINGGEVPQERAVKYLGV